ncbi:hypothetical protein B0H19DRAFT_1133160, partial [Mycena capillaripes]
MRCNWSIGFLAFLHCHNELTWGGKIRSWATETYEKPMLPFCFLQISQEPRSRLLFGRGTEDSCFSASFALVGL